jgi:hypothetical protein
MVGRAKEYHRPENSTRGKISRGNHNMWLCLLAVAALRSVTAVAALRSVSYPKKNGKYWKYLI